MPPSMSLELTQARQLNPLIRLLRLRGPRLDDLPGFKAGAHIPVQVRLADGSRAWRHYSLINLRPQANACEAPRDYQIAVRLEPQGRGGSRFMHELAIGEQLLIEAPKNDFALHPHAGRAVLIAGGIGITPLASMVAACRSEGRAVRLHYAGRSRALMAFLPELHGLLGTELHVHADDETGGALDIDALLRQCDAPDHLYVCGPPAMLEAVLIVAARHDWPTERLHFERFNAPPATAEPEAFEVVLAQSGRSLRVPAGQSLLDCLIAAGCDPLFDCRRGECGVCAVPVLEGEIEHHDHVLSAAERRAGNVMQVCVSRAKGPRLVLDL